MKKQKKQKQPTFLELVLAGKADANTNDIKDFISKWHNDIGETLPLTIHDALGFTIEEYAEWVVNPSCLNGIVADRRAAKTAKNKDNHDTIAWVLGDIEHEIATGIHTYHACSCGRSQTRSGECYLCALDKLEKKLAKGLETKVGFLKLALRNGNKTTEVFDETTNTRIWSEPVGKYPSIRHTLAILDAVRNRLQKAIEKAGLT